MATELEVHAHRIGVLGATGATGRYIVQQCVACPAISRVYVYTRKEIPPADIEPLSRPGGAEGLEAWNHQADSWRPSTNCLCCVCGV